MFAGLWSTAEGRLSAVRNWARRFSTRMWDRVLAVVFTAFAFLPGLSAISGEFGDLPRRPSDLLAVLLILGQTLPLAVRTRWPAWCFAVSGVCFAAYETLSFQPTVASVAFYFSIYSVAAHQARFRRGVALLATAGYVALSIVLHTAGSPNQLADYTLFYLALGAFWVTGAVVRRWRASEAERRRLAGIAATTAERARIARELHDVVTHHVTAMVVQADATQFRAQSPDAVVASVTAISGTGRRALAELRFLLGVLEATGDGSSGRREAALGTFRDLVEQTRAGGQPVALVEDGARPALAVGVELAAYRVVQEALTNAVKHATGRPTEVRVRYGVEQLDVEVTNDSPVAVSVGAQAVAAGPVGGSGGRGLTGLRDRVSALGGELTAGARPDGGFTVHARIPLGGQQ